jgi:hypothetical protein
MASADFSKRIPWPCGLGSLIARHVWRSPRVRRNPFPRLPPDLPMSHPSGYRASLSMARLPCEHRPCIRFLFVGSEFCLRLPPDPASRQRPCLQLTVPTTTACSGLAPYRITSCLAHHIIAKAIQNSFTFMVSPAFFLNYIGEYGSRVLGSDLFDRSQSVCHPFTQSAQQEKEI